MSAIEWSRAGEGALSRPIAIDLFAGAGGMSLGFEQAGFDVRVAAEIDPVHCAVHAFNFPRCAIIPGSVADLSAAQVRAAGGLRDYDEVSCVFGGPPCQGFSLMGQRALEDPRNSLVLEFVRLVSSLRARTFVFENVKGLTVGAHKALLAELVAAFQGCGYEISLPWRVLDAADFGVPQHRERLILLGALKGTPLPRYPPPRTMPADRLNRLRTLPKGPTCMDALQDLPDVERFPELLASDQVHVDPEPAHSAYAANLRCSSPDDWHLGFPRHWDRDLLTASARTDHTDISRRRFSQTTPGTVEPVSRFFKLAPDGLSNTLRAGTDSARGAFTSPRPVHYAFPRCVTVREMARLHGYPDWFRPHATKWHGAREVGNSVPPPLARAIADEVRSALGMAVDPPSEVIPLGDVALLSMTASEAAEYLGITRTVVRRDRKSGARKRSQLEVEAARLELGNGAHAVP